MRIRSLVLALACAVVGFGGRALAQPGTAYLQVGGGGMIPVGDFAHQQNIGGGYTVRAGYEFIDFLDVELAFTHSFNDNDDGHDTVAGPGFTLVSDEVKQTFVVGFGPRVNFLPADFVVRPYGRVHAEWFHFANFNSVEVNSVGQISDEDDDAAGLGAGLGVEGSVFTLYENQADQIPLLEVTLGAEGIYHHAFMTNRADRQFVTVMGSVGLRF